MATYQVTVSGTDFSVSAAGVGQQGAPGVIYEGEWATSTAYLASDVVVQGGSAYICILAHTSGASTQPGIGASWETYWDIFVTSDAVNPTFGTVTAAQYDSTEALPDIKPSLNLDFANTKALDPRITYTRGSTATYYDGKTFAKAEENLLTYSQEFDNAFWSKVGSTVTANDTTAPDGTTTAETITLQNATGIKWITANSGATNSKAVSFFVKAGTHNFVQILLQTDSIPYANFDVGSGVLGTVGSNTTASIIDVGNGWYRCSAIITSTTAGANVYLAFISSSTSVRAESWTSAGTETIYIWGAQVEQRDALTDYTATTTQPITNYIPALQTAASGEPRFDHDPITGESKGFLIEEQRTNLLTYSEDFSDSDWAKIRSSITANTIIAPDGTLTGDKLVEDTTASNTHHIVQTPSVSASSAYTISIYAKAAERTSMRFIFENSSKFAAASFNLTSGTVGSPIGTLSNTAAAITSVGNGWYRCAMTVNTESGTTTQVQYRTEDGSGNNIYTGDGYSGIYVWGAQLEQGSFPTSYIPTVASQVTRSPDAASMTGTNFSSWYRQDEGTFYSDLNVLGLKDSQTSPLTREMIRVDLSSATSNAMVLRAGQIISGADFIVLVNGVSQVDTGSFPTTSLDKLAFTHKLNDFAAKTNNNTSFLTDANALMPVTDRLFLRDANAHFKKLAYYPKRLSNATLQALTEE